MLAARPRPPREVIEAAGRTRPNSSTGGDPHAGLRSSPAAAAMRRPSGRVARRQRRDALAAEWRGGLLAVRRTPQAYRFAHALVAKASWTPSTKAKDRAPATRGSAALESSAGQKAVRGRIADALEGAGDDPGQVRAAAEWERKAAAQARSARAYDDAARLLAGAGWPICPGGRGDSVEAREVCRTWRHAGNTGRPARHVPGNNASTPRMRADTKGPGRLVARRALVLPKANVPAAAAVITRRARRAL